jgi:hypothetical protein
MGGPPWGGGTSKPLPYPTMSVEEIADIPVRALAEKQAHLYVWTINAYVEDTYDIVREWGFRPSTLLTWCKPITNGGLGGTYRIQHGARPLRPPGHLSRQDADRAHVVRVAPPTRALAEA